MVLGVGWGWGGEGLVGVWLTLTFSWVKFNLKSKNFIMLRFPTRVNTLQKMYNCHHYLDCFKVLTVWQYPSSACTYILFTVWNLCAYIDLGSQGVFWHLTSLLYWYMDVYCHSKYSSSISYYIFTTLLTKEHTPTYRWPSTPHPHKNHFKKVTVNF